MYKFEVNITGENSLEIALPIWRYSAEEASEVADYEFDPSHTITLPEYALDPDSFVQHFTEDTMWAKYAKGCLRTWNHAHSYHQQIGHACGAVVGEVAEYMLADVHEELLSELGDILYYRTLICYFYGMNLEFNVLDISTLGSTVTSALKTTMFLADVGKKAAFTGGALKPKTLVRVREGIQALDEVLSYILITNEWNIEDVMQSNLAKLSERYEGGKFVANLA